MELSAYVTNFEINDELIKIMKAYLSQIFTYLNANLIESSNNRGNFSVVINDVGCF